MQYHHMTNCIIGRKTHVHVKFRNLRFFFSLPSSYERNILRRDVEQQTKRKINIYIFFGVTLFLNKHISKISTTVKTGISLFVCYCMTFFLFLWSSTFPNITWNKVTKDFKVIFYTETVFLTDTRSQPISRQDISWRYSCRRLYSY